MFSKIVGQSAVYAAGVILMAAVGAALSFSSRAYGEPEAAMVNTKVRLIDPRTGNLVDPKAVAPESTVTLAPGEIKGTVRGSDGVALDRISVALLDGGTGAEAGKAITSADGAYSIPNVAKGLYVAKFGDPGIGVVVNVADGAQPGVLNVVVPKSAMVPATGMSGWPVLAIAGGVVIVGGTAAIIANNNDDDHGKSSGTIAQPSRGRISPYTPRPD
jgi:hypothetical protein